MKLILEPKDRSSRLQVIRKWREYKIPASYKKDGTMMREATTAYRAQTVRVIKHSR